MKTAELFEASQSFEVEHHYGRSSRKHVMSMAQVLDSILFSHAEKKKIGKLEVGGTLTLKHHDVELRIARKT